MVDHGMRDAVVAGFADAGVSARFDHGRNAVVAANGITVRSRLVGGFLFDDGRGSSIPFDADDHGDIRRKIACVVAAVVRARG